MRRLHVECGPWRLLRNVVVFVTLVAFVPLCLGCATWKEKPIAQNTVTDKNMKEKTARFHLNDGRIVEMRVKGVDYPFVSGDRPAERAVGSAYSGESTTVDLRDVAMLEVRSTSGRTLLILAGVAIIALAIILATAHSDSPAPEPSSSESSCPVVYVQAADGDVLAGEPYAGAISRSTQRSDLLPLPELDGTTTSLKLASEARETQYTDFVELVIADHPPGTRVVATNAQEAVLVGSARPPLEVVDQHGSDVTGQVTDRDGSLWQTDLYGYVDEVSPPLREELVARFPRSRVLSPPVLELDLANTYWLDLVINRFFALLGDKFEAGFERANLPEAGPLIQQWISREGVDLKVECKQEDEWREIGRVPPIGPVALRHVAVVLPQNLAGQDAGEIQVRISGGCGFWKVDRIGLSDLRDGAPPTRRFAPTLARDLAGNDEREVLADLDGRYQVLAERGHEVHMQFNTPPRVPGRTRTAFLRSSGFYLAHRPIHGEGSLPELQTILDEEGALARFSLDIVREYHDLALSTPRQRESVPGGKR
jgi:hypothetical protein